MWDHLHLLLTAEDYDVNLRVGNVIINVRPWSAGFC